MGEKYHFAVTLDIANLRPEDIGVEMVVAQQIVGGQSVNVTRTIQLERTKADGRAGSPIRSTTRPRRVARTT